MLIGPDESTRNTQDTIAELYARHARSVRNFAFRMTGDVMAADDITQETFIRVHRKYGTFRGRSEIRTWICSIAKNCCLEHMRALKRSKFRDMETLIESAASPYDDDQHTRLETAILTTQIKEGCLLGLLRCLPFNQRLAFILVVLQDMSADDVSTIIGKTPNAVRILVHRARESLRRFLCAHCSLYDERNACRCENLVAFSLKNGWIDAKRDDVDIARIESELRIFRNEVALYKSIRELEPTEIALDAIVKYIERSDLGIFSGKK